MTHNCTPFEAEVITGCQKRKEKYQEMLYKHFYGYAMSISLRYTHSREEATEIVNDSFLKVFNKISEYNFSHSFRAWFRRIIVNTAIDRYRREFKHMHHANLEVVDNGSSDGNLDAISQLTVENILQLLNDLPDVQRIVFNLYEIEGYSHDEIADMLQISPSSSRVYLTRAKQKLRTLVNIHFKGQYERSI